MHTLFEVMCLSSCCLGHVIWVTCCVSRALTRRLPPANVTSCMSRMSRMSLDLLSDLDLRNFSPPLSLEPTSCLPLE